MDAQKPSTNPDDQVNFLLEYGRTPCTADIWDRLKPRLFDQRLRRQPWHTNENIYSPLGDRFKFRVLFLELSAHKTGELKGTFIYQEPSDLIPYDCLSYTWGNGVADKEILIDGIALPITSNLDAALREIRSRPDPTMVGVPIWVDSICINQPDINERNLQVRQMGDIYAGAEKVIVFLGIAADGSEHLPRLFRLVGDGEQRHPHHFEEARETETVRIQAMTGLFEERGLPSKDDEIWRALERFMARPWFSRAWVAQEAALARKILYVCGEWACPGEVLPSLLELTVPYLTRIEGELSPSAQACQKHFILNPFFRGQYMDKENLRARAKNRPSLPALILGLDFVEAKDPRDLVYAYLALGREGEMVELQPRYDAPVMDTYTEFARLGIKDGNGVHILYGACVCECPPGAPSWVPNWEARRLLPLPMTPNPYAVGKCCMSAGGASSDISVVGDGRIRARNTSIGTIKGLAEYPHMTPARTHEDLWFIMAGPNNNEKVDRFRLTPFILQCIQYLLDQPNSPYGPTE